MKISAKIVTHYQCSTDVLVRIQITTNRVVKEVGDFVSSAELAWSFIDELDRLNQLDQEVQSLKAMERLG